MGWANAISDAIATVNLTITDPETRASEEIAVTNGVGYHDKNWGDRSVAKTIQAWNWGHARIREYSVVWFDVIDQAGKEHVSGYVAKNGRVLAAACDVGSVKVRLVPNDNKRTGGKWPPTAGEQPPAKLTMTSDAGEDGFLQVDTSNDIVLQSKPIYRRWTVPVRANIVGQKRSSPDAEYGKWSLCWGFLRTREGWYSSHFHL